MRRFQRARLRHILQKYDALHDVHRERSAKPSCACFVSTIAPLKIEVSGDCSRSYMICLPATAPEQQKPPQDWQPYMGNLAVAKKYRGNGYGKQLVRLCEHVARNHWG